MFKSGDVGVHATERMAAPFPPQVVYGLVYLSRFDEAFLILMSSPGPGTGKSGPTLVPLSALWTSASKLKVTPHLFFWTAVEASHEQKVAPGGFRLHTSWMSLIRACFQVFKKKLPGFPFLWYRVKSGLMTLRFVCSSPAPLSDDDEG